MTGHSKTTTIYYIMTKKKIKVNSNYSRGLTNSCFPQSSMFVVGIVETIVLSLSVLSGRWFDHMHIWSTPLEAVCWSQYYGTLV